MKKIYIYFYGKFKKLLCVHSVLDMKFIGVQTLTETSEHFGVVTYENILLRCSRCGKDYLILKAFKQVQE